MVAGADEHRRADRAERAAERLQRLLGRMYAVKQITGQKHNVTRVRVRRVRQLLQKRALLLPPLRRLLRRESGERCVQMQVGGMQKFNQERSPFLRVCSVRWTCRR